MATRKKGGSTAKGRTTTVRNIARRDPTAVRRELANQRRAFGAAGAARAARNWGLSTRSAAVRGTSTGRAMRGSAGGGGRNG